MGLRQIRLAAKRLLRDYNGIGTDCYRIGSLGRAGDGYWWVTGEPRAKYANDEVAFGPTISVQVPGYDAYYVDATPDFDAYALRRPAWERRARRR